MQQFKAKLKYVPTDAPQVCSSTSTPLNRDESLSVASKVLTLNNLEVDPPQHKEGQSSKTFEVPAIVCVLSVEGKPLMPCSPRKARVLLKKGEAHVVEVQPFFTIQLHKPNGNQVQKCSLGIDSGSKKIGYSVITEKKELVAGDVELDQKTSERLSEKRMNRSHRRNKLWYREPRFNNRKIPKGWLPPSIVRKFNTHINFINKLRSRLPINEENITIEVGSFDIQKIENPDISGNEYNQGPMLGYQNMRNYLMSRENGKCQLCNKEFSRGNSSHIHHIIPISGGGPDKQDNLALLHKKCHIKLHNKKLFNLLKKNKQYKDASFMNLVKLKYIEVFPKCNIVYGYETFINRVKLGLEKTHYNDAFIIAGGSNQIKAKPIYFGQKHKNNRVLQRNRKGHKPSIKKQKRYLIQPYDIVTIKNKKYMVKGSNHYGEQVSYFKGLKKFYLDVKKIEKVYHTSSVYLKIEM